MSRALQSHSQWHCRHRVANGQLDARTTHAATNASSQTTSPMKAPQRCCAFRNRTVRHTMAQTIGYASTAVTPSAAAGLVSALLDQASLNGVKHAAERHGAISALGQVVGRNLRAAQNTDAASSRRGLTQDLLQRCVGLLLERLVQPSADARLASCESLAVLARLCELPVSAHAAPTTPGAARRKWGALVCAKAVLRTTTVAWNTVGGG